MTFFGKPFVCDGTWRAPDSNKIFHAAIANLHTANNQKGVYQEACKDQFMKMTGTRGVFIILAAP